MPAGIVLDNTVLSVFKRLDEIDLLKIKIIKIDY